MTKSADQTAPRLSLDSWWNIAGGGFLRRSEILGGGVVFRINLFYGRHLLPNVMGRERGELPKRGDLSDGQEVLHLERPRGRSFEGFCHIEERPRRCVLVDRR